MVLVRRQIRHYLPNLPNFPSIGTVAIAASHKREGVSPLYYELLLVVIHKLMGHYNTMMGHYIHTQVKCSIIGYTHNY